MFTIIKNRQKTETVKVIAALAFCAAVAFVSLSSIKTQAASPIWNQLKAKYREKNGTNRLIFVKYTGGTSCKVVMLKKTRRKSGTFRWTRILSCSGYVGRNGIGKTREGDVKTPVGTFKITEAFGIKENPGTTVKYTKVNPYLYWSGEYGTYNTMVDSRELGHVPENSEHLIDYVPHYNYGVNMGYNKKNVFGKGSALFLHCFGSNPYTGGCVAVSEENMVKILQNLTRRTRICIYPA